MTLDEAIAEGSAALGNDAESARRDARLLLGNVCARTAAWMMANGDAVLADDDVARFYAAISRRAAGEPVAYILGQVGFYGRTFTITPDVLIPRPETEQLVTLALEALEKVERPLRLCDVGTGSGAIAITLAAERPDARVVATDLSPAALTLAAKNAKALGVETRIEFRLQEGLCEARTDGRFGAIVANLPYVRTADLAQSPDPTSFEPRLARDGGRDGLAAYRTLLRGVSRVLHRDGWLVLEAGPDTVEDLKMLALEALDGNADARVVRDYAGLPRIVEVRRTG
jgi:release factor glutamine methyltransferase